MLFKRTRLQAMITFFTKLENMKNTTMKMRSSEKSWLGILLNLPQRPKKILCSFVNRSKWIMPTHNLYG